ncbi:MAG: glycosyltransferase family 2 protein [Myxococcales bacterium]|nr:glycosyltransferase family 2 protein [Myxococcales bacterium]
MIARPPDPLVSVVTPARDEAGNLAPFCDAVRAALPGVRLELLVVDDGSRDATLATLRALAAQAPDLRYLSLSRSFGQQAALKAGLDHARGDCVITLDVDGEHPAALLPELLARWQAGAAVVRTRRVDRAGRRWVARAYYRLLRALGDVQVAPGAADFRLLDRAVVEILRGLPERDLFWRGLVAWLGFPQAEVAYAAGARRWGVPSYRLRDRLRLAASGVTGFGTGGLRWAAWPGALAVAGALGVAAWAALTPGPGWRWVLAAVLGLGGLQLLVLAVMGLYVGRLLLQAKGRPVYLIQETDEGPR